MRRIITLIVATDLNNEDLREHITRTLCDSGVDVDMTSVNDEADFEKDCERKDAELLEKCRAK